MTTITAEDPKFDLLAPLGTDAQVLDRVDHLIALEERRGRSLWLFFLTADAVQLPVLVPIDDMPAISDPDTARSICRIIADVLDESAPGGSAVITLVQDTGLSVSGPDRQWLTALRSAAATTGAHLRMLCLATTHGTRQLDP